MSTPALEAAEVTLDSVGARVQDPLYRCEEFGVSPPAAPTIFFICPFDTSIERVRFAIRRLCRAGYRVVAYQTTGAVFRDAVPAILPELISAVREDIRARIAKLKAENITDFGLFGSSLGSFILYNCIGDEIPELRWGVFNTGGNIAQGLWRIPEIKQRHEEKGWSLPCLEEAWAGVQWPDFGRLDGCKFLFVSSRRDGIAPLSDISQYLEPMRQVGAEISTHEVPAIGHITTVIMGLWRGPQLVRMARSDREVTEGWLRRPARDPVRVPAVEAPGGSRPRRRHYWPMRPSIRSRKRST